MGRTQHYHSIVLRTHDVGEADRFCILLTKERGKIAARAYGVRKPKSRIGGSLLALQETVVTVREGSAGMTISGASCKEDYSATLPLPAFLQAQQAIELLLSVLEDDHPMSGIFEITKDFLSGCANHEEINVLSFHIKLMQLLGVFPKEETHQIFSHFSTEEREFIRNCSNKKWWIAPKPPDNACKKLRALCTRIMSEQTNREFRAAPVSQAVLG